MWKRQGPRIRVHSTACFPRCPYRMDIATAADFPATIIGKPRRRPPWMCLTPGRSRISSRLRPGWARAGANFRRAPPPLPSNLPRAFTELLFSQTSIEVSRTILERRQRNAQLVALRYDSGRESRGNMLRSRAQALQAQTDLAAALRDLRTSQKSLQRRRLR